MSEIIRVMVVDDHPVVRRGMKSLLEEEDDIELVGEAVNGKDAIEKVEILKPDVILMDLVMPEMGGIEAIEKITASHPGRAHPGHDQLRRRRQGLPLHQGRRARVPAQGLRPRRSDPHDPTGVSRRTLHPPHHRPQGDPGAQPSGARSAYPIPADRAGGGNPAVTGTGCGEQGNCRLRWWFGMPPCEHM